MKLRTFLIGTLVYLCIGLSATNYYFSNSGFDTNNGMSPNTAWQTLSKLSDVVLMPGDSLLFRKGDVFLGEIIIKQSGTDLNPIVITSYGSSNFTYATLTGATSVADWKVSTTNSNIFTRKLNKPVKYVYSNNKLMTLARYPNAGSYLKSSALVSIGQTKSTELTQSNDYWIGATLRQIPLDWVWENTVVTGFQNQTLSYSKDVCYQMSKGNPFYLENKKEQLDFPNEWFYDNINKMLMYYPEVKAKINTSNVKAVIYDYGITINSNISNIKVSNLHFDKYADYGVQANGVNSNIYVENSGFQNIGKMAIKFWRKSTDCKIANNTIKNILGRGISLTECSNFLINNNTIKNAGIVPGQGTSGVNGASGIVVEVLDETMNPSHYIYGTTPTNNIVSYNIVDSCGYNGIRVDGANSLVDKNIIDHSMLTLKDGAGLYSYSEYTHNNTISNNFVYRSKVSANGIYIDNRVNNITILGNTLIENTGSGIFINAESHDNIVSKNVCYNNGNSLGFADWATVGITGNKVVNNKFINFGATRNILQFLSNYNRYNFAVYDSIYYVNPTSQYVAHYMWSIDKWSTFEQLRLDFPESNIHSKAIMNFSTSTTDKVLLFTNKSDSIRKVALDGCTCMDLDSNLVSELQIKPFSSEVLIKNDLTKCTKIVGDLPVYRKGFELPITNYDKDIFADITILPSDDATSVIPIVHNQLNVYPHPVEAGGFINISGFKTRDSKITIQLNDINGRTIKWYDCLNQDVLKLQMPTVTNGIYVLSFKSLGLIPTKKIAIYEN